MISEWISQLALLHHYDSEMRCHLEILLLPWGGALEPSGLLYITMALGKEGTKPILFYLKKKKKQVTWILQFLDLWIPC